MLTIYLLRHGPKNDDPNAHQGGIGASLDPEKIHEIHDLAERLNPKFSSTNGIQIYSIPVNRARITAEIFYNKLYENSELRNNLFGPTIEPLCGSCAITEKYGEIVPVNLSPPGRSEEWKKGKEAQDPNMRGDQDKSLFAWINEGFDNTWENTGISLREIASRIGTFIDNTLSQYNLEDEEKNYHIFAFSHSGDIEPWLYLTLAMDLGLETKDPETIKNLFHETNGALNPLEGIRIEYDFTGLYLFHPTKDGESKSISLEKEILQEQAAWFHNNGISEKILKQRLILN